MANIYSISSNYDFLHSLSSWVFERFNKDPQKISKLVVILPNKRSCNELRDIFAQKEINLPQIKAISDISLDDFHEFFGTGKNKNITKKISKIKRLSDLDYLFFLSAEIAKTELFKDIDFSQSFGLASNLKNLFDDISHNESDIEKLAQIDDSDLAKHRQFSLEFLQKFYIKIRNKTIKKNIYSDAEFRNFIIKNFAKSIDKFGLKNDVIFAGSTGSIIYVKQLIKSILGCKNGHVILPSFAKNRQVFESQKDPQFFINELVKFLEIKRSEIVQIKYENLKLSPDYRYDFVLNSMLPSQETHLWNEFKFDDKIAQDFKQNFSYFEVKNQIEEAKIVAKSALDSSSFHKKTAIITSCRDFSKLVKFELTKLNLVFNDAGSLDIKGSSLINFILLIAQLMQNNFESATLLSILKHPFIQDFSNKDILEKFEIDILRSQKSGYGISAIKSKIKYSNENLQEFFSNFLQKTQNIQLKKEKVFLAQYFQEIINSVENLTQQKIEKLVDSQSCSNEISQLFDKILSQEKLKVKASEIFELLQKLFANIAHFQKPNQDAKIEIISPIEARLLNFDTIIVPCLNHSEFPQIQQDNWLGKKIRRDLGIDLVDKKYGQTANDFCNYLSNKEVILTRSLSKNNSPTIASPFILRLKILLKKIGFEFGEMRQKHKVKLRKKSPQLAKVKLQNRPKSLSVSDIGNLISDPYQIYAKKILQLKELEKIDYEPSNKEFGSFVHKALEEFINQNKSPQEFLKTAKNIFSQFFYNKDAKLTWWPKFENIFRNFIAANELFKTSKNFTEIELQEQIKQVSIKAKIDRIAISSNNEIIIFDYKTGQIPSKKDILSAKNPQLPLYALLLSRDKNFENSKIQELSYWKLSSFQEGEIKSVIKNGEVKDVIESAEQGLEQLFSYYEDEENHYKISQNQNRKHQYSHLERIF